MKELIKKAAEIVTLECFSLKFLGIGDLILQMTNPEPKSRPRIDLVLEKINELSSQA